MRFNCDGGDFFEIVGHDNLVENPMSIYNQ